MSSCAKCTGSVVLVVSGFHEIIIKKLTKHSFKGRHNCLWCHITSADLSIPLAKRGPSAPRSLQTLKDDHSRFTSQGHGDLKVAKLYNNVIGKTIFDIPLDNVRMYFFPFKLKYRIFCVGLHSWIAPIPWNFRSPVDTVRAMLQGARLLSGHRWIFSY